MIFLLGASGYVGSAFQRELTKRNLEYRAISRRELDYSRFNVLTEALQSHRPQLVIHCGGFTGKPNVDACETQRSETILGNIVLAQTVAQACEVANVRLGVVASGCIYTGAQVESDDGSWSIREDLNAPDLADLLASRSKKIHGFDENDAANFTFETGSSFYSGTKAVAEKMLAVFPSVYIWRLRMPFEERHNSRNYLSKLQTYPRLYQNWNSLSHLGDFTSTCMEISNADLPGGAYNLINPGYVSTREVVALIRKLRRPGWEPDFWDSEAEFYQKAAVARRSNCLLRSTKLEAAEIKIRDLHTALADSIRQWSE
jgi:dTDP-4-dehydrorhamnose reductase